MARRQAAIQLCVVHIEFLAASMQARFAEDARGNGRPEDEIFSSPATAQAANQYCRGVISIASMFPSK